MIGKGEQQIRLPQPIPIHLTYFTLEVDSLGEIRAFTDLYGINKKIRDALGV